MNKKEIIEQTILAFDLIQKLYLEVSYLIKEVEGLLGEEEENFQIGRIGGYAVTAPSSLGLEVNNVNQWLMRKMAVSFIAKKYTLRRGGANNNKIFRKSQITVPKDRIRR